MKAAILSFFALVAAASANEAQLIADAINQDRALRGNPNPLDMTPEERDREMQLMCRAVRNFIPRNCVCTGDLLSLTADFVCTSPTEDCLPNIPIVGTVCSTSQVTGNIKLAPFALSATVAMKGCATGVNSDSQGELGDVCASLTATTGISGVSIDACELTIGDQTCDTCIACETQGGSNGFGFNCDFLAAEFCVPIGLPFVGRGRMAGTSMREFTSTPVWTNVAEGAAVELATTSA
ncbi:hypothetical protein FisN_16Hh138 [Fistulifera solaris]|uniref:Uncharacterized protein n=1 Tax=Fistulifera solaris TaxID=1519565 RepID=A0A1Z5KTQ6_FISSO|nr:hypothetical protein FisN_16Hh138 [Fistulifera solaris]|eukprot:GAX29421.1 hypothetical protein FisN_16Hh138 [Fistulifera solaris]